jgi:hypothetical protein
MRSYTAAMTTKPGWAMGIAGLLVAFSGAMVIFFSLIDAGDNGGLMFGWLMVLSGLLIRIEAALHGIAGRTSSVEDH